MDKEKKAIERLKYASEMSFQIYQKPLLVTTSGGKDSDVCLHLVKKSGIPFEVSHSHTTVDAPETVMHVREQFKELELGGIKELYKQCVCHDLSFEKPVKSMVF